MSVFLASLPNSRIKNRPPTSAALTDVVAVGVGPGNTLVAAANADRTYLSIRNEDVVNPIRYDYFDNPLMATEGYELKANEAADLSSPETVYALAIGGAVNVSVDEGSG